MVTKIVSRRPNKYFTQKAGFCGGYTIKGVLSAWGLDDKENAGDYVSLSTRLSQATLPSNIVNELNKHGFIATLKRANKLSDKEKIELLKKEIDKDRPVIILEGCCFTRKNKFRKKKFYNDIGHWISIWGYDDKKEEFYVYDSYVEKKHYSKVPIGNARRTFAQLLQVWEGPLYSRFLDYIYIPVVKE